MFFGKRSVYLVTDLCRGGELFELLNAGKNEGFVFREDRASQLMRDMLSAVHYLHSKVVFSCQFYSQIFFTMKIPYHPLADPPQVWTFVDFSIFLFFNSCFFIP